MDKYIGKKLEGRYEIIELIGIGGMANVYKAKDLMDDKIVAAKLLKDEYMNNDEFLRRFRNESKAIAVLSHPNIVRILDVGFSEKVQFIIMEYIDGITLKDYIEQQKVVKWKEVVHFTIQILRALQHAHDNGIIHRDVKPHNIMLLQDGTIKMMDFGIALFSRSNIKTITDKAIGSVHYISPEQAKGDETDQKSDLYSVGIMLYEMLTGELPFDGDSAVSIALMQMQNIAKPPREINSEIPEGLEEITLRAMQKEPEKRYQSAAEMLHDFDEFKKNPSIVFEYKYMNEEQPTKYFDKPEEIEDEKSANKKSKGMWALFGVAIAFVIAAIIFVVSLVMSSGGKVPEIEMPNLIGQTEQQIRNNPEYKNLQIKIETTEFTDEYEKGIIFYQNIEAGRKIKNNAVVKVKVSKGMSLISVPDVSNKQESEAKKILEEKGFKVNIIKSFDPNITKGFAIKTSPEANTQVKKGDEITIYISLGKEDVSVVVPDVVGKTEGEAKKILESKKLKYSVKKVKSDKPEGEVVNQSVVAGSQTLEGSTIELEVSNGETLEKTLDITINFPSNVTGTYEISAIIDGNEVASSNINVEKQNNWTFKATGSGKKTILIKVKNQLYIALDVNFDTNEINKSGEYNTSIFTPASSSSNSSSNNSNSN